MRYLLSGLIILTQLNFIAGCDHRNPRIPAQAEYNKEFDNYFEKNDMHGVRRRRMWTPEGNVIAENIFSHQKGIGIWRTFEDHKIQTITMKARLDRKEKIDVTFYYDNRGEVESRKTKLNGDVVENIFTNSDYTYGSGDPVPVSHDEEKQDNHLIHRMYLKGKLWVESSKDLSTGIETEVVYDMDGNPINRTTRKGGVLLTEEIVPWGKVEEFP